MSFFLVRSCSREKASRLQADQLREEIFARDTLLRHNDSLVSIIVRDNLTAEMLNDSLSKELQRYVKDRKLKPVIITQIEFVPVPHTDTVLVHEGIITTYYPDVAEWIIQHTLQDAGEGNYIADWQFQPINVDLVISETKSGLYEAAMSGPGFLRVRTLEVNSLPHFQAKKKDNGILIGAGGQYDWKDRIFTPTIQLGYTWNKHSILGVGWHQGAGLYYLKNISR